MGSWPHPLQEQLSHSNVSEGSSVVLPVADRGGGWLRVEWDKKGGAGSREAVSLSTEKEGL